MWVVKKRIPQKAEFYKKGMEDGWAGDSNKGCDRDTCQYCCTKKCPHFRRFIYTMEGRHFFDEDAIIMTGIDGERYLIDKSVFERTYDILEDKDA